MAKNTKTNSRVRRMRLMAKNLAKWSFASSLAHTTLVSAAEDAGFALEREDDPGQTVSSGRFTYEAEIIEDGGRLFLIGLEWREGGVVPIRAELAAPPSLL